jgi:hypothetical protein
MTATVVSLSSRIRNRPPACGCPRHRLEALTERALADLAGTEGELLIPREVLEAVVDDLVTSIAAAVRANGVAR